MERADPAFEYEAEQGGLDGRRRRGQLVQEQQSAPGPYESHGPVRRGHRDTLRGGIVSDDGQTGEVGRLVHAGDHRGQGQVQGLGELGQGRGLADAGLAPQEHRQVGGHGQGQGRQLVVGARFGGGVAQQGQQLLGDGELVEWGGGTGGRERGVRGHG